MDRQRNGFPIQPLTSQLQSNAPILPVGEPAALQASLLAPDWPECLHAIGHRSSVSGAAAAVSPCLNSFAAFFDAAGRCWNEYELHKAVYWQGIEKTARRGVWPCLLGVYPADLSNGQRSERTVKLSAEYRRLSQSATSAQASRLPEDRQLATMISQIEKDVQRTDRNVAFYGEENGAGLAALRRILTNYAAYNPTLGYVQGMSDIASVVLLVMKDEAMSFWCFVKIMEGMGGVFTDLAAGALRELAALVEHVDFELYAHLNWLSCGNWNFCLRWMLLGFKRELSMNDIIEVWERVWSRHKSVNLIVYMVAGELLLNRFMLLSYRSEEDLHQFTARVGRNLHVKQLVQEGQALVDKCKPVVQCVSGSEEPPAPEAALTPPRNGFIPRDAAAATQQLRHARLKSALTLSDPSTGHVQLASPADSPASPGVARPSSLSPSTIPPGIGSFAAYNALPPAHTYQVKSPSSYMDFGTQPPALQPQLNQLATSLLDAHITDANTVARRAPELSWRRRQAPDDWNSV